LKIVPQPQKFSRVDEVNVKSRSVATHGFVRRVQKRSQRVDAVRQLLSHTRDTGRVDEVNGSAARHSARKTMPEADTVVVSCPLAFHQTHAVHHVPCNQPPPLARGAGADATTRARTTCSTTIGCHTAAVAPITAVTTWHGLGSLRKPTSAPPQPTLLEKRSLHRFISGDAHHVPHQRRVSTDARSVEITHGSACEHWPTQCHAERRQVLPFNRRVGERADK